MKKTAAIFLLMTLFFAASAQKNFLPGYIVLQGKDTLRGQLNYRDWEKNPTQVQFAPPSAAARVCTVQDLEAFGVDGLDHYRKVTVLIDANPVEVTDVSGYSRELIRSQTVFLRILASGNNLDLYEYVDFKPHYFIAQPGGPVEELSYKVMQDSLSGGTAVRKYKDFQVQLKKLLASRGLTYEQSISIDKLDYKAKDLVKFVSEVNGITGQAGMLQRKKDKPRFFAGAGLVFPNFGFSSGDVRLNSLKFKNDFSGIVTAGIDFFVARSLQNLVVRGEISFSQFNTTGSGESAAVTIDNQKHEYILKQTNITPAFSLLYHFIRQQKAKIYGGAGVGYNFSSYPEQELSTTNALTGDISRQENVPQLEKNWMAVYLHLGVAVISKIDIGLTARVHGSFVNYSYQKQTGLPLSFCVRYRFN